MASFPSLPLFVREYLVDTTELSLELSGAYLHLLMHAWVRKARLPDDDAALAAFCKVGIKKWRSLRPRLEGFFTVEDGEWVQERLLKEWLYVEAKTEKRRSAGAKGGATKSTRTPEKQSLSEAGAKQSASTHTNTQTSSSKKSLKAKADASAPSFEEDFWKEALAMARRLSMPSAKLGSKTKAEKAWNSLPVRERAMAVAALELLEDDIAPDRKRGFMRNTPHLYGWLPRVKKDHGEDLEEETDDEIPSEEGRRRDEREPTEQRDAAPPAEGNPDRPTDVDDLFGGGRKVRGGDGGDGPVECAGARGHEGGGGVAVLDRVDRGREERFVPSAGSFPDSAIRSGCHGEHAIAVAERDDWESCRRPSGALH